MPIYPPQFRLGPFVHARLHLLHFIFHSGEDEVASLSNRAYYKLSLLVAEASVQYSKQIIKHGAHCYARGKHFRNRNANDE